MTNDLIHKNKNETYDVIIIGGGLAGLVSSILLARNNFRVILFEKKTFPFHKVCGEYVSNEVLTFLESIGFDPKHYGASAINKLRISSPSGKNIFVNLDLGGFGLSRFVFDESLAEIAHKIGVVISENSRVSEVQFDGNIFAVSTAGKKYYSNFVIGSYGKREILDKKLQRKFIDRHTGYMGVKYHVRSDYPPDEIGLDNFPGGYCGIAKIEGDKYNLCYLYKRNSATSFKDIHELEDKILFTNPTLKKIFKSASFIFDEPQVINEIYFKKKSCVENNMFMCGDSAGLITPLCGNGMAMAIHGAKILSELIIENVVPGREVTNSMRSILENKYKQQWKKTFSSRLFWGRKLQSISGKTSFTSGALQIIHALPSFENWLISKTHGKELESYVSQKEPIQSTHQ